MGNLDLYEKVRKVPTEAQKKIAGGRLSGMTDINPMWRIKTLTEQFGVCGIGWYTEIVERWLEQGANEEKTANIRILLYIKVDGEWSKGIEGVGGASFVAKEKSGFYTDDECYKKAYTDAISVACKALGIGADVYWDKDKTKYDTDTGDNGAKIAHKTDDKPTAVQVVTEEEIRTKYGGKTPRATILWLEEQYGKKITDFTAEENAEVRGWLQAQKDKREKGQGGLRKAGDEFPFDV